MRLSLTPKRSQFAPSRVKRTGWGLKKGYHGESKPDSLPHTLSEEIEAPELDNIEKPRGKAFTAMFNSKPFYAFHIVSPRSQRKTLPRPLRPDELFQMPDVVLDLDAYDASNVRKADIEDQMAMVDTWALTEQQKNAQSRVRDLKQMIKESRATQEKVMSNSTNPWRITSHDVLSTALRGPTPLEYTKKESAVHEEAGGLQISLLTYATPDQECQMKRYKALQQQRPSEERGPSASDPIDPRRSPDFLEEVRVHNGIPSHATESNELLIRWVVSRRDLLQLDQARRKPPNPSARQIASDLQAQSSINGIRRVVFHSITANADLNSYSPTIPSETEEAIDVAEEIRNACVRVMDASPGHQVCFDTLEFVNNLSYRLPYLSKNLEACVVALRLRSLARVAQLSLTARQLQCDFVPEVLNNKLDILPDVKASLESWNMVLREAGALGHESQRRLFFTILTGYSKDELAVRNPFRDLLLSCGYPVASNERKDRQEAYEQYIHLLGHLGAIRTIWKEWRTYTSGLFHGAALVRPAAARDREEAVPHVFSRALTNALSFTDPECFEPHKNADPSLAECQQMDYSLIGTRMVAYDTEQQAHLPPFSEALSMHELPSILELPLNDSLKALEKLRQGLRVEQ